MPPACSPFAARNACSIASRSQWPTRRRVRALGDLYANVIYIDRKPVVLAVSKQTLLPVLVPLAPASALGERLRTEIAGVLGALQVPREAIDREVRAMTDMVVAKTDDRAIVGTLVDFARLLEMFEGDDRSLRTLALDLAQTPCSVLGVGSPRRATAELFSKRVVS